MGQRSRGTCGSRCMAFACLQSVRSCWHTRRPCSIKTLNNGSPNSACTEGSHGVAPSSSDLLKFVLRGCRGVVSHPSQHHLQLAAATQPQPLTASRCYPASSGEVQRTQPAIFRIENQHVHLKSSLTYTRVRPKMVFGHNLRYMAPFDFLRKGFCMAFRHASFVFSCPGSVVGDRGRIFGTVVSILARGPFWGHKWAPKKMVCEGIIL